MRFEQDSFETLALFTALLLGKMFFVSALLVISRLITDVRTSFQKYSLLITQFFQTFSNPEDAACSPRGRVSPPEPPDPMVERYRRLLISDLEDIFPFIVLSFLFLTTNPAHAYVAYSCKVFFTSRILHTLCYIFKVRSFRFASSVF